MSAALTVPYGPPGSKRAPNADTAAGGPRGLSHPGNRADALHFRIVYLLALPVMTVISLVRRVLPGHGPDSAGEHPARLSILGEARAAAQTCGSLSLMG
jgi:hypothetical protein